MALYDSIGSGYARFRTPDARIAAVIDEALGDCESVINVGAGAGSYEPKDRHVLAVEPSARMIAQRPEGAAPCVQGTAEALPVESQSADAAMAILSAHHWPDLPRGLAEMRRVARKRVVLLTWVADAPPFWLTQSYFPEIRAHDHTIFPDTAALKKLLGNVIGPTRITTLPIPHDCADGFLCAYWRRPELYLDDARRSAMSSFARIDAAAGLEKLRADLDSGYWVEKNSDLLALESFDAGYRIVTCDIKT